MKYYFEVDGMAVDENGNSCAVGVILDMGDWLFIRDEDIPDTIEKIADTINVSKNDVYLITEEEYYERYGAEPVEHHLEYSEKGGDDE